MAIPGEIPPSSKEFDESDLDDLAASLKARGQIQPCRVRRDEGHGRRRAPRAAPGWRRTDGAAPADKPRRPDSVGIDLGDGVSVLVRYRKASTRSTTQALRNAIKVSQEREKEHPDRAA